MVDLNVILYRQAVNERGCSESGRLRSRRKAVVNEKYEVRYVVS